jgi:hypothetical protein
MVGQDNFPIYNIIVYSHYFMSSLMLCQTSIPSSKEGIKKNIDVVRSLE